MMKTLVFVAVMLAVAAIDAGAFEFLRRRFDLWLARRRLAKSARKNQPPPLANRPVIKPLEDDLWKVPAPRPQHPFRDYGKPIWWVDMRDRTNDPAPQQTWTTTVDELLCGERWT